ncbi:MAG: MarR family transcriptional regulator [Beijerinckiaceae bacterium]|nr:MarR family transcriptional regulator [Beijerinckiaceae bacterium]
MPTSARPARDPAVKSVANSAPLAPEMRGPTARVGHLLRRAYQLALENSARGFADLDLTPRQAAAVWEIHVRGSLSQRELGEAIGMDAPNVHGLVTRLLKRGAVSRQTDCVDPRRKLLSLTLEGASLAAVLPERARLSEEATLAGLSANDRASLVKLLESMIEPEACAPRRKLRKRKA